MLTALMGGMALTAGELAREAGVTAQTASSHLGKLAAGGLVTARPQGRCVYYALADREVADLMEQLAGLAAAAGHRRARPGPRDPQLRRARVCSDHLAGELTEDLFPVLPIVHSFLLPIHVAFVVASNSRLGSEYNATR